MGSASFATLKKALKRCLYRKTPQQWSSTEEYAQARKIPWHVAYPRTSARRQRLSNLGDEPVNFEDQIAAEFPDLGVLELAGGYVLCPQGWVFTRDGWLLPETSWFGLDVSRMKLPERLPPPTRVRGTVLSILSDWANINYGHLMLDSLSRYHLFETVGLSFDQVDHVLCPGEPGSRTASLVAKLGLPAEKCLWSSHYKAIQADRLLVTSYPGCKRNYPDWLPPYLQRVFGVAPPEPVGRKHRRLYITRRGGKRLLSNERELLPILQEHNFEVYDPVEHPHGSPEDFAAAELVVGPHGAGLADIAFCRPEAKVLELIPSDHQAPYYYTLADSAGLRYACLVGRSAGTRRPDAWGPSKFDFVVEPRRFETALRTVLSRN